MTDFVQLVVAGLSLGSIYALICLAFVVVYRATGVLNFALGGLVVLGAYVTFQFGVRWGFLFRSRCLPLRWSSVRSAC